uniref:Neur_chan_LBD domain-containing protein n=1 Tax=Panagrellus redivivus TaxID=6233 RepID=A0A7E4ZTM0_PANRE
MKSSSATVLATIFALLAIAAGQQLSLSPASPLNSLDPCKYFENVTDTTQLSHHEFVAYEQCVYYFLASKAQKNSAKFGTVHPIATLPPTYAENAPSTVKVKIGQITLQHFQLNEFVKDLNIVGYMQVEWPDKRLAWDANQWRLDKLQIHSANHIWIPVLSSQAYETSLRNDDAMEVRKLEANSAGNVSAIVSFSLKTFCDDTDFRHFPDDVYKCCYQLEPHFNQELIEFGVDGQPVFTDPKYFRDYGWSVSGTVPTVNADPSVVSQLNFCINLQRSSSAVKIELAVPTWVCSIVFLFTPFMGKIRVQLSVKLFLLLLQFLTLQLFSNRIASHLGSASATPVLLAFHEFAMVMNTISIVASVLIWMLSRIKRTLPPWGWLIKASQIINRFICVFNSVDENDGAFELEKGGLPGESNPNSRYQSDWEGAFLAIHGVAVTALALVFIIGYIVIR